MIVDGSVLIGDDASDILLTQKSQKNEHKYTGAVWRKQDTRIQKYKKKEMFNSFRSKASATFTIFLQFSAVCIMEWIQWS